MKKIVTIHQPAFLPWLGLMSKINEADEFVMLDTVQFSKGSFDNRNRINDGKKDIWLTVPVSTKGKFKQIPLNEIEVADMNFRMKHCQVIMKTYDIEDADCEHSPFLCDFRAMYHNPNRKGKLFEFADESMRTFAKHLDIKTPFFYNSSLKTEGKGSELILNICKAREATHYLSGPMGRDYLDLEAFKEAGIEVLYHKWNTEYYLSTIHYVATLGVEKVKELMKTQYEIQTS